MFHWQNGFEHTHCSSIPLHNIGPSVVARRKRADLGKGLSVTQQVLRSNRRTENRRTSHKPPRSPRRRSSSKCKASGRPRCKFNPSVGSKATCSWRLAQTCRFLSDVLRKPKHHKATPKHDKRSTVTATGCSTRRTCAFIQIYADLGIDISSTLDVGACETQSSTDQQI